MPINNDKIRNRLSSDDQARWDLAIKRNSLSQAVGILVNANLVKEAIGFCEENDDYSMALDLAMQAKEYDHAEAIAVKSNNALKQAEILLLKGQTERAAECFIKLKQYAKAAKLFMQIKSYEKAAQYYEKARRFMDATMCYQKAGNVTKQLEMQIAAFEADLAIANDDLSAVSVSRMMAIQAAKQMLDNPDSTPRAVEVLKRAQALDTTIDEFEQAAQYQKAATCCEQANDLRRALQNYIRANDTVKAIRLSKKFGDDTTEIETLKSLKLYFKLGQKLIALGRFDEALSTLKLIDSNHDTYSHALELQGDIYCKLKNYNDAILCYESLLWTQLPNDRICRIAYKLGYSYEAIDDNENAQKNYQKVIDIDPNFHDIADVSIRISEKIKNEPSAKNSRDPLALSPLDNGHRRTPSKNVMRTPSRNRVSTIRLCDQDIPAIGNERYRIIEEVAHGGMGVIYKATDTLLMRTVALKVLSNKLKDNEVALEYFMREARASAALQHINIVTIYDIGSLNDGNVYIAMEYIEGKNLKQLVQQTGAFPTKFLTQIAVHAGKGLQYAHDNGIIPRDVKSSNMMLAKKDKSLKILDLGLAKMVNNEDKNSTQAIGTPYYMSPEQVLGSAIDCRSDIYSLGVTLYECATGVLPFVKGDLPYKHVHEPPPPLHDFNEKVNPQIETIVLKMMAKDPNDRFASCNDCISALRRVDIRSAD